MLTIFDKELCGGWLIYLWSHKYLLTENLLQFYWSMPICALYTTKITLQLLFLHTLSFWKKVGIQLPGIRIMLARYEHARRLIAIIDGSISHFHLAWDYSSSYILELPLALHWLSSTSIKMILSTFEQDLSSSILVSLLSILLIIGKVLRYGQSIHR